MPALKQLIVPAEAEREPLAARVARVISRLPPGRAFRFEIHEHKPRRSNSQNSLLHALEADALRLSGLANQGWEPEDLHEHHLMEYFGTTKLEGPATVIKPIRRSSSLNKQEFSDYIDWIVRYWALKGIVLKLPDDSREAW